MVSTSRSMVGDRGLPLVSVREVSKHFPVGRGGLGAGHARVVHAVDRVSFAVHRREVLAIVGETGCGKSTTARIAAGYITPTGGAVELDGHVVASPTLSFDKAVRRHIQMIAQDPYSSLNPRHTVGSILSAPFRYQGVVPPAGVQSTVYSLLDRVGLARSDYNRFPGAFSGGQRQRIAIARALALGPRLIVADEPVSSLDVSIRAQILNLLLDLQQSDSLAMLFISHDLSVVRHIADRIAVMYFGKVVEVGARDRLFASPRHPYTCALLNAAPIAAPGGPRRARIPLPGEMPNATQPPPGCRFQARCWKVQEVCRSIEPPLDGTDSVNLVACHFPEGASG